MKVLGWTRIEDDDGYIIAFISVVLEECKGYLFTNDNELDFGC